MQLCWQKACLACMKTQAPSPVPHKLGMVASTFNVSTWVVEVGGSEIWGHSCNMESKASLRSQIKEKELYQVLLHMLCQSWAQSHWPDNPTNCEGEKKALPIRVWKEGIYLALYRQAYLCPLALTAFLSTPLKQSLIIWKASCDFDISISCQYKSPQLNQER